MQHPRRSPSIVLASASPRRRYLLEQAGLELTVVPSGFDERSVTLEDPSRQVVKAAEGKAADVARRYPENWVIGADTIVVIGGRILGKPASADDARRMLSQLSGRTHQVYTGYCITRLASGHHLAEAVKTDVVFKQLSAAEIDWYLSTGEPFDKAGAYAIQGIGTFLVKSICGSYTNVVGLPVCEVIEHLLSWGVIGFS